LRFDATQLAHLDFKRLAIGTRRQYRTGHGAWHFHADPHIRCAAHDIENGAGLDVDLADIEAIRIGMLGHFQHFTDDDVGEWRRNSFHLFHFQAGHGEQMRQFIRIHLRIDHGTQPVFRELHD